MLYRLAVRMSRYMESEGACSGDDMETVAYGLFSIMSDAVQVVVLIIFALLLDIFFPVLSFSLAYCLIRRNAGGAHADTQLGCLISFTLSALAGAAAGLYIPKSLCCPLSLCLAAFTLVTVFLRAPVTHPSFPRPDSVKAKFRRKARITALVLALTITISSFAAPDWVQRYILCAGLGCGFASVMLLIPFRTKTEKGGKGNEKSME